MDGECQVERDLGTLAAERDSHCNLNDDAVSHNLSLKSCGPRAYADWTQVMGREDGLTAETGPTAEASPLNEAALSAETTPWARSCVILWRKIHGSWSSNRVVGERGARHRWSGVLTVKSIHHRVIAAATAAILGAKAEELHHVITGPFDSRRFT